MQQRIDATKVSPAAYKAVAALQPMSINPALTRNCANSSKSAPRRSTAAPICLVMHTRDARKHGESDDRMHLLNAWREAPVFTPRERAALGLDRGADAGVADARAGRRL